ncbi:hypothetical protein [Fructobacillus papyrifericola]|uniref:Uncharacterized protein n=1 Tax=Fructobacillus papyrifericola TaxID=2713172 RepID=A0ABS5QRF6_9LACO|nr:hypothetical protein [Fructobacillus papyrifericola]MBS9335711.1 hypothetical protein [Fructobacillus papyrifericola]
MEKQHEFERANAGQLEEQKRQQERAEKQSEFTLSSHEAREKKAENKK